MRALVTSGQPWQSVEFHAAIGSTNSRLRDLPRPCRATRSGPYAAGPAAGTVAALVGRRSPTTRRVAGAGSAASGRCRRPGVDCRVVRDRPAPRARGSPGGCRCSRGSPWRGHCAAVTRDAGTRVDPRLKWPNDVLLPRRRRPQGARHPRRARRGAARRLMAHGTSSSEPGVNVDQDRDELPVDTATSLRLAGASVRPRGPRRRLPARARRPAAGTRRRARTYRRRCTTTGSRRSAFDLRRGLLDRRSARARAPADGGALVEGRGRRQSTAQGTRRGHVAGRRTFAAGDVVHVRRP